MKYLGIRGCPRMPYALVGAVKVRRSGLVTLPARMHEVQTFRRLVDPSTTARTRWMLGFHCRLVRRCECDTFIPKLGCFPQISQTAAMMNLHLA